jgi:hypothetical protein
VIQGLEISGIPFWIVPVFFFKEATQQYKVNLFCKLVNVS